eukprot:92949-Chlamydomonas_euryale.AAC.1
MGPTPLNLKPRSVEGPPRKKRSAMHVGVAAIAAQGSLVAAAPAAGRAGPEAGAPPTQGSMRPTLYERLSDTAVEIGSSACAEQCGFGGHTQNVRLSNTVVGIGSSACVIRMRGVLGAVVWLVWIWRAHTKCEAEQHCGGDRQQRLRAEGAQVMFKGWRCIWRASST